MSDVNVTIRDNGPYLVQGAITIKDQAGNEIEATGPVVAFCRCGQSAGKPFCDGAHAKCGFDGS
jgi:3-phenylpropionate/trans-cinnamate dioxygenase ferredoxin subunit